MCDPGNLGILLCNPFCGIDHHQHHIRSLYCRYSTNDTESLQLFLDLIFSSQSRGIDKNIFSVLVFDCRINGISCGARDI